MGDTSWELYRLIKSLSKRQIKAAIEFIKAMKEAN